MGMITDMQALEISPLVLRQLQNQHNFKTGTPETTGMLFGSVDTIGNGQVHYAPTFFPQISPSLRLHDYAYGRYEASIEAAYHLHGWMGLGYWLAYQGRELSKETLLLQLNGSVGGEMALSDHLLLTIRLTSSGSKELRAYTYGEYSPLTGWRELSLINADVTDKRSKKNIWVGD